LLGKVADLIFLQAVAKNYLAVNRFLQAKDCPHKRGLSASVLSDNAKVVARVDAKVKVFNEDVFIVAKAEVLAFQKRHGENYAKKTPARQYENGFHFCDRLDPAIFWRDNCCG